MSFLTINRGDNFGVLFQILEDGDYMDLSVVTLARFTIKSKKTDADSAALVRKSTGVGGVTILDQSTDPPTGTKGQITVDLTHSETAALPIDSRGVWDIQLTLNDGSVVTPYMGEVAMVGDVTINSGDVGTDV